MRRMQTKSPVYRTVKNISHYTRVSINRIKSH